MEELVDLVATESSPSQITDKIKEILFAKASERIENVRPEVASAMFDFGQDNNESEN